MEEECVLISRRGSSSSGVGRHISLGEGISRRGSGVGVIVRWGTGGTIDLEEGITHSGLGVHVDLEEGPSYLKQWSSLA